jgi:nucleoid DNA-binding protein
MRKQELARQLARKTGVSRAEAADQVDRMVNEVLMKLRNGQGADWPGMGKFSLNAQGRIEFRQDDRNEK